ncbi:DUF6702 family protein, partial [Chryseobacterium sp. SIMBA_038]
MFNKIFFSFLLSLTLIFQNFMERKVVHPYHVGSVEINYNSKSKTFEVTGRFFL